jgi:hypothetical protein
MLDLHQTADIDLSGVGQTDVTLDLPLGTKIGDILIMVAVAACAQDINLDPFTGHAEIQTPAGWNLLDQESVALGGGALVDPGFFMAVFWRAIVAAPPATVTVDTLTDRSAWSISIVRISNVSAPDVANAAVSIGTNADPSVVTNPSVTTTQNNALLIACFGSMSMTEADLIAPPPGMTHICHMFTQQNICSQGSVIFAEGIPVAGATGTRQLSVTVDGLGQVDPTRVMGFQLAVIPNGGVCADGKTFFIGTDKGYSE